MYASFGKLLIRLFIMYFFGYLIQNLGVNVILAVLILTLMEPAIIICILNGVLPWLHLKGNKFINVFNFDILFKNQIVFVLKESLILNYCHYKYLKYTSIKELEENMNSIFRVKNIKIVKSHKL